MKLFKSLLLFCAAIPMLTGCATIVSKSVWPFSVDSNPPGATVVITNKKGNEIYRGKTPTALRLKSGAGFFSKESYVVSITKDGFETRKINVECKINGWYFGNVIFGGVIGLLIVDPASGAMFKLDNKGIYEDLKSRTATTSTTPSLNIIDKNHIPKEWEEHLVRID